VIVEKGHDGVFHFFIGSQYGFHVHGDLLLEAGVLHADVVYQPTVIQHIPTKTGSDGSGPGARIEQIAELRRFESHRTVQRNVRIEIGLGDADIGVQGGSQSLGAAHIGPTPQ